jgi:uncharacterized protein YcbK (DUF882 family)
MSLIPNKQTDFACKGKNCCGGISTMTQKALDEFSQFELLVYDYVSKKFAKNNQTEKGNFTLKISSAFRCITHNESVGGSPNSYHPKGMAIDVHKPKELNLFELYEVALCVPGYKNGGIGVYPWGLHIDVRNGLARWFEIILP